VAASIDVVVPARDHYALTLACLQHLERQTAPHRVIVVDDGSCDGTPALLRRDWPRVRTIELSSSRGYTRAVNEGVKAGDGDYVVLLNNDVQLDSECLQRLVAPLDADEQVGSVAALMLAPGKQTIDSVGVTADATLAGFARLQGHPAADANLREPVLTGPEGTAGAYRRRAWDQACGLDETIRAYMEILDLALRLRAAGWKTASAPDAVGVHHGSGTYGRRSATQRHLAGFSRGYLLRRYGVMSSRAGARALLTETLVVAADALLCRDLSAARGRAQGWHAARGRGRHPWPPQDAIDRSISMRRSLTLRMGALRGGDR
jgi:N-acetylglucosaminyl-diphospho-decaprenol L-rhamnosyltransferase